MRQKFKLLRALQVYTFNKSDLVIFISKFAQKEVSKELRAVRSTVIYHGVSDSFKITKKDAGTSPLLSFDYVLYVSHLYDYKAHLEVVKSWHEYKKRVDSPLKLVFLGYNCTSYGDKVTGLVNELNLENDILLLGEVDHLAVYDYYDQAKLLLFASGCENCPNILLEAMASGVPILCSNYGPMPELALDTVHYFDPYKTNELENLLVEFSTNDKIYDQMGIKSKECSKRYSWKVSIENLWQTVLKI
jgi:glycosyltransferase involved in cell wall biosynthesis